MPTILKPKTSKKQIAKTKIKYCSKSLKKADTKREGTEFNKFYTNEEWAEAEYKRKTQQKDLLKKHFWAEVKRGFIDPNDDSFSINECLVLNLHSRTSIPLSFRYKASIIIDKEGRAIKNRYGVHSDTEEIPVRKYRIGKV